MSTKQQIPLLYCRFQPYQSQSVSIIPSRRLPVLSQSHLRLVEQRSGLGAHREIFFHHVVRNPRLRQLFNGDLVSQSIRNRRTRKLNGLIGYVADRRPEPPKR